MGVGLLDPVPCGHLPSALDIATEGGVVAFGTMAFDVFHKLQEKFGLEELPVLIYGSEPHSDREGLFVPGRATLTATLIGFRRANAQGRHPQDERRPKNAPPSRMVQGDGSGRWRGCGGCRQKNGCP